jgi:C_GCAxxG_C_C family probable redox protein
VLLAVCQEFEIEVEKDVIPQIAIGFAGGMGITGSVCGAVVGSVMALGLKMGRGDTMEEMLRRFGVTREFRRRFEAEMGTISCHELTGLELTELELTMEGLGQLMSSDMSQGPCVSAVGHAYQIVVDMLKEATL